MMCGVVVCDMMADGIECYSRTNNNSVEWLMRILIYCMHMYNIAFTDSTTYICGYVHIMMDDRSATIRRAQHTIYYIRIQLQAHPCS